MTLEFYNDRNFNNGPAKATFTEYERVSYEHGYLIGLRRDEVRMEVIAEMADEDVWTIIAPEARGERYLSFRLIAHDKVA